MSNDFEYYRNNTARYQVVTILNVDKKKEHASYTVNLQCNKITDAGGAQSH